MKRYAHEQNSPDPKRSEEQSADSVYRVGLEWRPVVGCGCEPDCVHVIACSLSDAKCEGMRQACLRPLYPLATYSPSVAYAEEM